MSKIRFIRSLALPESFKPTASCEEYRGPRQSARRGVRVAGLVEETGHLLIVIKDNWSFPGFFQLKKG